MAESQNHLNPLKNTMLHYSRIMKSGFTSMLALGMAFHAFGQQREVTTSVPKALRDDITIE